jgi:hypothetical protein
MCTARVLGDGTAPSCSRRVRRQRSKARRAVPTFPAAACAHQDPPAALAQFVQLEQELRALDGRRGLAALELDACHALHGADPELVQPAAPLVLIEE